MGGYIFSLSPTFTQGLVLGQLSILFFVVVVLRYLFLETEPVQTLYTTSTNDEHVEPLAEAGVKDFTPESAEWLNAIVKRVLDTYRGTLRSNDPGPRGKELLRERVEQFVNRHRPSDFLDPVRVTSVDLGKSCPRIVRARKADSSMGTSNELELDIVYRDSISVSLSTSVMFNYPVPGFARLPISLTVSLSVFSATVGLLLPDPASLTPALTLTLLPDFTLDLRTSSLLGSKAKLADVPKLHEMIQSQVRKLVTQRGAWKVILPGTEIVNLDDGEDKY